MTFKTQTSFQRVKSSMSRADLKSGEKKKETISGYHEEVTYYQK